MKKSFLVLIFVFIVLAGCSSKAKIEIFNNTDYNEIWYSVKDNDPVMIDSFQKVEIKYDVTSYLLFNETKEIYIEYGGKFVVTKEKKYNLAPGDSRNIEILTDAGEMIIQNGSFDRHVNEVYIVESGEDFEVNLLTSPIGPWQEKVFNLESGFWDLKIVDNTGDIILEHNIFISLEASWTYTYVEN